MPQTDKPTIVAQYIYDFLRDDANMLALGLEDVFEDDQDLIPRVPAACVVLGEYRRELTGIPFRTDNNFTVYVMLYHAGVKDVQLLYRECNERAEAVMDLLHTDKTMGGNVIHGYVTTIEPGYVQKKTLMYASRITWTGLTKTLT